MQNVAEEYLGAICEIKSISNVMIATGIVNKMSDGTMEIVARAPDRLPLISANSPVKIGVYNHQSGMQILVGQTYLSTETMIRIVEVQTLVEFEKREFFRVQVTIETTAYPAVQMKDSSGAVLKNKYSCDSADSFKASVHDISLSGLYFSSARKFEINSYVAVKFPFDKEDLYFCQIIRERDSETGNGYGCLILPYTERQSEKFCQYLFTRQREMIHKAKQYMD